MKIKNISKKIFRLASGECNPGEAAEATFEEAKLLFGQDMAVVNDVEITKEPVKKTIRKTKVKED